MTINLKDFDADASEAQGRRRPHRRRGQGLARRSRILHLAAIGLRHPDPGLGHDLISRETLRCSRQSFSMRPGTLFEAREPVGHTYARIARKHGLHADDSAVSAGFRRAFASTPGLAFGPRRRADDIRRLEREWWYGLVRRSFEGLGEFDSFDAFFDELFAYFGHPANWEALPEAQSVLRRLKDENLKLGIISNFDCAPLSHPRGAGAAGVFRYRHDFLRGRLCEAGARDLRHVRCRRLGASRRPRPRTSATPSKWIFVARKMPDFARSL